MVAISKRAEAQRRSGLARKIGNWENPRNGMQIIIDGCHRPLPTLKHSPIELRGLLPDKTVDEHKYFDESIDWRTLIAVLPTEQQTVVMLRYGLAGHKEYALAELGRVFSVSSQRISQIEQKGIAEIKRRFLKKMPKNNTSV